MSKVRPRDVLDFWFAAGPEKWWKRSDAFDDDIRQRFGATLEDAIAGRLDDWLSVPEGALALVIVLDQFSRNLYRRDHRAWTQDGKAMAVMRAAMERRFDVELPVTVRNWIYMPLMHSEDLGAQHGRLPLLAALGQPVVTKFGEEPADLIKAVRPVTASEERCWRRSRCKRHSISCRSAV